MSEKVLMKGNEALAEAAIRAGCKHFFGYPITPQTELAAYMSKRMPKIGGTYLQAESEVAAINMVYGASAAGVRVMTSSSSPGVSLKAEGVSYMIGSDLPAVIINVQRGGPGLGGIQPSQADYWQATRAMGHGDGHVIVFAPSTVQEMADLVARAFDLGDRYRTPVMILADGLLGQMMEPVVLPEPVDESNLAPKEWATSGHKGLRPRNTISSLFLDPQQLESSILERRKRYELIQEVEQMAQEEYMDDAEVVVVAYGAASRIVRSAVNKAREEGLKVGFIRPITLWPFPTQVIQAAAKKAQAFLSVEFSTGQMVDDIRLAIRDELPVNFFGHTGGVVPDPDEVLVAIKRSLSQETFYEIPYQKRLTGGA
ncbi:MAG: 3-methyl-2-oxobutanoate dehydrogenase subunit VorB [Coriobacteriales bacterium]|jgi:2-oxoglutarate ferredoxin oxidoreductase subunit alpha|nr:3-methyl-2-oxobutanoate dehydrogenase subunit VorB [Coriobacteriales bacterium]